MPEPIAIVGMAAVFPGAPDLGAYGANIEAGVDAIRDVPPDRLDPVFLDAFSCKRGGFIAPTFDPIAFGIMPVAAAAAEPDQLLALAVAAAAIEDAGGTIPRDRAGVILGRGGYLTPGMARLANRVRTSQQLVTTLGELLPDLDAVTVERIRAAFHARAGEVKPDAAIGLVPNLAASRIANRLDLRGPAYTVDAACASSLLAIDQGCRELADRRCDAIVAGGVHVCHDPTFWNVFSELGALSRSSAIRPFDRRADGIVIGEGAGVVVLKRLADAERDGDRIYAVILGAGVSSDGRESSAMRPRADGQHAAIDAAWRAAGRDPTTVGLVEAHGTATPTGDETELAALARCFGETTGARAALGSVKSMIGHAMPAAGAAGLIKTALALHRGVLPPSLHCEEPHPALATTRFRVLAEAEDWGELPRRAGVSAFGFGGINAHVVLEAHASSASAPRMRRAPAESARSREAVIASAAPPLGDTRSEAPRLLAIAGDTSDALREALDLGQGAETTGAMRLALLDPTPERRELARKVLDRGRAWRGKHDIWFSPEPTGGRVAFVFPGIEVAFAPDVADVARALGSDRITAIEAATATDDLERRGLGVYQLGRLLFDALDQMAIRPDVIAGHSLGEWTAMIAGEMIPLAAADELVKSLQAGSLEVPDVVFAAVGCGAEGAQAALEGLDEIAVSHDNCPHQSILCGKRDRVRVAIARLGERGVLSQELPFRSGFHSPLFAGYLAPHRRRFAELPLQRPRVETWSATSCAPYPADPDEVRALAIDHLVKPVRFRELIEALYATGVRAFVQLGVGSTSGFVGDTLRGREHLAIAAATQHATGSQQASVVAASTLPGTSQLTRVAAALWVDGFTNKLHADLAPTAPTLHANFSSTIATGPRPGMPLELGVPLVRLAGIVAPLSIKQPVGGSDDPVLAELLATLDEAASASRAVVDAYRAKVSSPAPLPVADRRVADPVADRRVSRRTLSVETEPALLDHCFYRQPPGWPTVADRYPVVPLTMTIAMMIDAAKQRAPGKVAIAVEDVRALRWLAVAPAIEIEVVARGQDRIEVEVPGYARATVVLADRYPAPPPRALAPLVDPRPAPLTAQTMYADRWMFHGPAYQGVSSLGPLGDDGVDGVIEVLPAPGALLDCAGQLMGWWIMQAVAGDRLAMPFTITRIALYGDDPVVGERVECSVRVRQLGDRQVRADLELVAGGRVWARIDGWEDRRFDSDDPVWSVLMYPETNVLAVADGEYVAAGEHWRGAASRELMMRRYLGERERAAYDQLGPRGKRGWLLGRIAVKDAVRLHRWRSGSTPIWPVEIEVRSEPSGQPIVDGWHVSLAHKDDRAVAIVDRSRAVGIDIERIEPRTSGFISIAYTAAELALGMGDAWLARLWAAKEAVAKARGTGITDPKRLQVHAVDGDRLVIDDAVIDTRRDGDYIIAWTKL